MIIHGKLRCPKELSTVLHATRWRRIQKDAPTVTVYALWKTQKFESTVQFRCASRNDDRYYSSGYKLAIEMESERKALTKKQTVKKKVCESSVFEYVLLEARKDLKKWQIRFSVFFERSISTLLLTSKRY